MDEEIVTRLSAHLALDVTLPQRTTTYVHVVEKALIAKILENQIRRKDAARRDFRRTSPPAIGLGKGGGPGDSKRKSLDFI